MNGAVELHGFIETKRKAGEPDRENFKLVPSGNDRNMQRVVLKPGGAAGPGNKCPSCRRNISAFVQTFPTEWYTVWTHHATEAILSQYQPGDFTEPVVVCCWVLGGRGFIETRDCDNVQKVVGDALVNAKVLPAKLNSKKELAEGDDDVRSIRGWFTRYLTREEHVALGKGMNGNADTIRARLYVKLVPASEVEPFLL